MFISVILQQYTVYKIGEKTDTNMGSISDANIANYYGYVYYNYVYDAQINSTTGKYDSPEEYFWSCDGNPQSARYYLNTVKTLISNKNPRHLAGIFLALSVVTTTP